MDDFSDLPVYVPILRTREAELRGFRQIGADAMHSMLPVFEFMRSRRSKNNPNGAVARNVDQVLEVMADRYFIADVTTLSQYGSAETQALLDPTNGFSTWQQFVSTLGSRCIPVVHLTDPFDAVSVKVQAQALVKSSGMLAVRIPPDYSNAALLENALSEVIDTFSHVIVICDAAFVDKNNFSESALAVYRTLYPFSRRPMLSVAACSSFPPSVVLPNYGKDDKGKFPLLEVALSEWLKGQEGLEHVVHGDYGLIYPGEIPPTPTRFVPRVDVPLDSEVFYHRYRQGDGGYTKAASEALRDPSYRMLPCWAHDNIVDAARGNPKGKSPSFWIAARVNYHLARQIARLT